MLNSFLKRYEVRIIAIFIASLCSYLAVAWFYHAKQGYYGTIDVPRFADPWLARGETILSGKMLYQDVFTTTPPLTNYLLLPPVIVSGWFSHLNPWSTMSFMVYFSLFNLFSALLLLHIPDKQRDGFFAATIFLLNPLTFGNTILRRQDESIIVFFLTLSLFFYLKKQHWSGAISVGMGMMVKLTGAIVWLVVMIESTQFPDGRISLRKRPFLLWRYFLIPPLVSAVILSPFLATAGRDAMFWDTSKGHTEHPFQYGGVSVTSLWNRFHDLPQQIPIQWSSYIFIIGVGLTVLFIIWKRYGITTNLSILIAMILLFSPKLHTGYFSLLILPLALLIKPYKLLPLYFLLGITAMMADFYKWPIENYPVAFGLMVVTTLFLIAIVARLTQPPLICNRSLPLSFPQAVSGNDNFSVGGVERLP